jgi:hypothetical protein
LKLILLDEAIGDLQAFDSQLKLFFQQHFKKLMQMPPRRHLKFGLPFYVEEVTRQARIDFGKTVELVNIAAPKSRPGKGIIITAAIALSAFTALAITGVVLAPLPLEAVALLFAFAAVFTLALDIPKYFVFKKLGI